MHTNKPFYPVDSLVEPLEAGCPILTPNHRLARRIKLAWGQRQQAEGKSSWETPVVMSLEHWWMHCYQQSRLAGVELPGLISPAQEESLWLASVSESDAAAALLRPGTAATLARQAWSNLALWNVDLGSPEIQQQFSFGEDSRLFLEWARAYERKLESLGLVSLASLASVLAEANPVDRLLLAEFADIPPRYRMALELQTANLVRHRAGDQSADCVLRPCESHAAELEAAAHWVRDRYEQDPWQRLGIVVPGLQQERRDVERLLQREFGSTELPVNFSAGIPLADCGPVRAAIGLLSLPVADLSLARLGQVLQTRYRTSHDREQLLAAWHFLLLDAREPVSPQELRRQLNRAAEGGEQPALLSSLLRTSDARGLRVRQLPSAWAVQLENDLLEMGWPGPGPLDSMEYQQVEHFYRMLDSLGELDAVEGELDYRGALGVLERVSAATVFQAQTPDAPIQVLGLLEAAGLHFDALWICNMGDREWPLAPAPNPFIPAGLQRTLGMPRADAGRELAYARELMAHLRQSCAEVIASFANIEEEVAVAASPLLEDFRVEDATPGNQFPPHWTPAAAESLEWFEGGAPPAVAPAEAEQIRGGSAILGNQAQCPFRAFAFHRLDARPFDDPRVALTPMERGIILHEALNHLWGKLEDSARLAATGADEREQLCIESAEVALDSFRQRGGRMVGNQLLALEQRRLQRLLLDWLDVEGERQAFSVIAREEMHELELGPLTITLRIDRVDQLADGGKLVIDYKTGDSRTNLWLGERPEEPQLPLYTQLLGSDDVRGISFAILRPNTLEYRGLASADQGGGISADIAHAHRRADIAIEDWSELQLHWQRVLQALGQEFLDGHAPVDPIDRKRSCAHCGLEALCRIR